MSGDENGDEGNPPHLDTPKIWECDETLTNFLRSYLALSFFLRAITMQVILDIITVE